MRRRRKELGRTRINFNHYNPTIMAWHADQDNQSVLVFLQNKLECYF